MCGGAEARVSSPEERIASIISEEAGVYINPQVVRMMNVRKILDTHCPA